VGVRAGGHATGARVLAGSAGHAHVTVSDAPAGGVSGLGPGSWVWLEGRGGPGARAGVLRMIRGGLRGYG